MYNKGELCAGAGNARRKIYAYKDFSGSSDMQYTPKALLELPENENSNIDELSYAYWLGYIYRCECIMHDESSRMVYSAFTEQIMHEAYENVVNSPMNTRNLSDCAKEICADLDRLLVEKIWPEKKHRKYI